MYSRCLLLSLAGALMLGTDRAYGITGTQNDINTLNYALTLEHLEAVFYATGQSVFSPQDFVNAGYTAQDYSYMSLIASQEAAHVTALTSTIKSLGGTPVEACNKYTYGVTSVKTYIAVAAVLETTGVSAYDGAINTLSNPTLQQVAATIATVEARHASYLAVLNASVPFPEVFDPTNTPEAVVNAISQIIANCGNTAAIPTALPVVRTQVSGAHQETASENSNDIAILQYALVLEHLESTFYNMYAGITQAQFTQAGYPNNVADYIALIRAHEAAHVSALQSTISSLGGSPVPACTYTFSSSMTPAQFIQTAQALENTGVMAYDGAANGITNPTLQQVAATIATVEGRHAAFLNLLVKATPFPATFDTADTPTQVAGIAGQFIQSCPFDLNAAVAAVKTGYSGQGTDVSSTSTSGSSGSGSSGSSTGSSSGSTTTSPPSGSTSGGSTSGSGSSSSTSASSDASTIGLMAVGNVLLAAAIYGMM